VDWNAVLIEHLKQLIRIDTTNPPGGELAAANYLAEQLAAHGIQHQVFEPAPGRGSIVARLSGDGSEKPLLLLGHLDVVPADAAEWAHPPFSGLEVDGEIWGRGAVDMKNLVAIWLTVLQKLACEKVPLKRDVIFAATADEEAGGEMGLGWLVRNQPDLVDCEYCLNEGGGNAMRFAGNTYFALQSGEKASLRVTLTARGTAGHASIPLPDNAVAQLAKAIVRVAAAEMPLHLTRTVRSFLSVLAADLGISGDIAPEQALQMVHSLATPFEAAAMGAMMMNTACPTMLCASQKLNVAPSRAEAHLNGRVLPGQSGKDLVEELRSLLGDMVEVSASEHLPATESDPDTALAQVISDVVSRHQPGAKLIPFLSPGATDARYLRPRGVTVYGFCPMLPGERLQLAHGVDERISVDSLLFGMQVLEEVVRKFAS
jgi:acetylornithine deacetylase/succinyl-diaminopimelate desuccinylase-like protein